MMLTLLTTALLAATAPDGQVVVQKGERLADVARRALGDASAAAELKALNQLTDEDLAPGTSLKLPGHDRELALSALNAARNAVKQADSSADKRQEAIARLKEAESLFSGARYPDAAKAADSAWHLVSRSAGEPTRFNVEVAENGTTHVRSKGGTPVRVEAQGVARPVYAGQMVRVDKGRAPTVPEAELGSPGLVSPPDAKRLHFRSSRAELGPVTLSWERVAGAREYEVDVVPSGPSEDGRMTLKVSRPSAKLPLLPAGTYLWSVRAVSPQGNRSADSTQRKFELVAEPLKLEVKGSEWK
jgi:hypothetical protein